MKISIVTPSLNQGRFIADTIRSVMRQDHGDIEHIVMDGGSTDDTLEILRKYPHLRWISEKDSGQSNAINRGFRRATGEIFAWLNSDDMYEPDVFGAVAAYFDAHPECRLLYGDITFVDVEGRTLFSITGGTMGYDAIVRNPESVRQPSCFWRSDLFRELGGVDESLHLVMDLDFLLRAGARCRFHYLGMGLSRYRHYEQSKSLSLARRQVREIRAVYRKNGIPTTPRLMRLLAVKYARSFPLLARAEQLVRGRGAPA